MKQSRCVLLALIAFTLLSFNLNLTTAKVTFEASPEELALIQHVKDNGGMVNIF